MIGYLIDAKWIQPAMVEAVEYLKLTGAAWVHVATLDEWNKLPEDGRAFQIRTSSGKDILFERPRTCKRIDLNALMVETEPERPAAAAAQLPDGSPAPITSRPGMTLP